MKLLLNLSHLISFLVKSQFWKHAFWLRFFILIGGVVHYKVLGFACCQKLQNQNQYFQLLDPNKSAVEYFKEISERKYWLRFKDIETLTGENLLDPSVLKYQC